MLGREYRSNPRDQVPPWSMEVVQLWAQCRGEMGMAQLPDPGGINDQAAWVMDAFATCGAAEAELQKQERADAAQR